MFVNLLALSCIGFIALLFLLSLVSSQMSHSGNIAGVSFSTTQTITGDGNTARSCTPGVAFAGTVTAQAQSTATISGATWSGGVATITTGTHNAVPGQIVTITGVTPSAYNGTYVIIATPSGTTFTVAIVSDPSSYSSGGSAALPATITTTGVNTIGTAARVDLYWIASSIQKFRRGITSGAVAVGNAIAISGGSGTALPANSTVIQVAPTTKLTFTAATAKLQALNISTASIGQVVFTQSDGTTEVVAYTFPTSYAYFWDVNGPIANPFGADVGYAIFSHNNTATTQLMQAGAITND